MYIDPTPYTGAPAPAGRDDAELRCYPLLESLGISFIRFDHEPTASIAACEAVEALLEAPICKNLFLTNRQQTDFYLLVMPGNKPFKTKVLSHQLGTSRLSFGSPEDMERLMDLQPGSVSILGLMNDRERRIRLVLDRDLTREPWFCCHPCRNTSSLRMTTEDMLTRLLPALGHEPVWVELPREDPEA